MFRLLLNSKQTTKKDYKDSASVIKQRVEELRNK